MLSYPTLSFDLWKSLDDPAARIDRVIQDRSHRLCMGVAVSPDVKSVSCVLLMTAGHGKFVRLQHVAGQRFLVPDAIQQTWKTVEHDPKLEAARRFMSEMADFQSQAIDVVKRQAGKYVDRILAVALTDAGIWVSDFDGSKICCPMTDSQRVADLTGLTVIDDFPANDLLGGGSGAPLDALPMWLAFSDRSEKIASAHRLVVIVDEQTDEPVDETYSAWLLPASDGLDAELPPIQWVVGQHSTKVDSSVDCITKAVEEKLKVVESQTGIGSNGVVRNALVVGKGRLAETLCDVWGCESIGDVPAEKNPWANLSCGTLSGATSAMLGLLHIDQLQANIPWLTGAGEQRVLGRLTPGSPSNWRQLVREMADFRPPAMKLKDAV